MPLFPLPTVPGATSPRRMPLPTSPNRNDIDPASGLGVGVGVGTGSPQQASGSGKLFPLPMAPVPTESYTEAEAAYPEMENLMADLEADLGAWDLGIRDQIQVTAMRQIRQLMLRKVKGEAYHRLQIWQSHVRTHLLTKEIETAHKVRISTAREETVVAKKEALMQREKAKQKTLNAAFGLVYRALRTYQLHSTAQLIGVWYKHSRPGVREVYTALPDARRIENEIDAGRDDKLRSQLAAESLRCLQLQVELDDLSMRPAPVFQYVEGDVQMLQAQLYAAAQNAIQMGERAEQQRRSHRAEVEELTIARASTAEVEKLRAALSTAKWQGKVMAEAHTGTLWKLQEARSELEHLLPELADARQQHKLAADEMMKLEVWRAAVQRDHPYQLAQQTMTEKRTGAVKDFRQCLGRIMKEAKEGYLLNWHYQAIEARHESHIAQVVQQEGKKLSRETAKRSALIRATRAKSLEKSGRLLLRLRHDMERGLLQTWQRNFLARERDRTAELEATLKELQTKFSDNIRNTIQIRLELGSEKAEMEALHGAEVSKMRKCPHCRPKTEQDLVAAFQLAEDANQLLHQVHKGTLGGNKLSARCFDGVVDRGEFDDDQVASQLLPREACIVGGEKGGGEVGLQALFDKVGSRGEQLQGQFPLGVDTGGGETGLMAEWAIKEYKLSRQAQHLMAKLTQQTQTQGAGVGKPPNHQDTLQQQQQLQQLKPPPRHRRQPFDSLAGIPGGSANASKGRLEARFELAEHEFRQASSSSSKAAAGASSSLGQGHSRRAFDSGIGVQRQQDHEEESQRRQVARTERRKHRAAHAWSKPHRGSLGEQPALATTIEDEPTLKPTLWNAYDAVRPGAMDPRALIAFRKFA